MAETKDGKGTTKLVTADKHNEVRRAVKAKQRRNRHRGGQMYGGFSVVPKATHRVELNTLDQTQANEAFRLLGERNLQPGSLAEKIAIAIITEFPHAQRDGKRVKTTVAVATVRGRLSKKERDRTKAVQLGIEAARDALRQAGDAVYSKGLVYTSR